jgi:glutathione S-transferase
MKIYYHPVSTTSRPLVFFAAETGMPIEFQVVDLFTGEQYKDAYSALNPNHLVPLLEDGDFRLTESSAILKYLADSIESPAYPKELRARSRVNERMDWINTQMNRDLAYNFVYPQILPTHRRDSAEAQAATLAWGAQRTRGWLEVLDRHLLGGNRYLCGNAITIADYFGAPFVALGELIRCDYSAYPNVCRWLGDMKRLPGWRKASEGVDGFAASMKDKQFASL